MGASIQSRVQKGAAWLDGRFPDWVNRIDLTDLSMNDQQRCIIGQMSDLPYYDFVNRWGIEEQDQVDLGFESSHIFDDGHDDYSVLRAAWSNLIESRRGV